jgi:hypothetical protein
VSGNLFFIYLFFLKLQEWRQHNLTVILRFQVSTVMKVQIVTFWVYAPCNVRGINRRFGGVDGGSRFLRNIC